MLSLEIHKWFFSETESTTQPELCSREKTLMYLINIDVMNLSYSRGVEVVLIWKMIYVFSLLADIPTRKQVYFKEYDL